MLRTIVEGEPGIFPNPVAHAMRKIGGLFDRKRPATPATASGPGAGQPNGDEPPAGEAAADGPRDQPRRTDESRTDGSSDPRDGRREPDAT